MRARPSVRSPRLDAIATDAFFLVASCVPGRRGARWCFGSYDAGSADARYGWVHESQFEYDAVGDMPSTTLAGYGVTAPLVAAEPARTWWSVDSDDGSLNLRLGPGTSHDVIRRLDTGTRVLLIGCGPRSSRPRWCLVRDDSDGTVGYVYDADLR